MHNTSFNKNIAPSENVSHLSGLGNKPFSIGAYYIMEEIWKDVPNYEGYYQVSNIGHVRSLERLDNKGHKRPQVLMNPMLSGNGYYEVKLCKKGSSIRKSVHRLVGLAFISNPLGKPFINHKDGNKHNNHVNNLEWCTPKENINHGISIGLITPRGVQNKCSKLSEKDVHDIRASDKTNIQLARIYNISNTNIRSIRIRKIWKHI